MHHADIRVLAWGSVELRKYPEEVRQQNAVHPAMADDEDRLARGLAREAIDRAEGAREYLLERLPARPRDEAVLAPPGQRGGLVKVLAGALPDVDLAQLWHHLDRDAVALRDNLRGVAGTREV